MKPQYVTIQMKAIEQHFHVLVSDNFAKWTSRFFPRDQFALLGVKGLNSFTRSKINMLLPEYTILRVFSNTCYQSLS